jgi:hypothetical protein
VSTVGCQSTTLTKRLDASDAETLALHLGDNCGVSPLSGQQFLVLFRPVGVADHDVLDAFMELFEVLTCQTGQNRRLRAE